MYNNPDPRRRHCSAADIMICYCKALFVNKLVLLKKKKLIQNELEMLLTHPTDFLL